MTGRPLRTTTAMERIGWLAYLLCVAAALVLWRVGGPGWAVTALIGVAFVLAVPLVYRTLWRGP